jgi:hypothetical protein
MSAMRAEKNDGKPPLKNMNEISSYKRISQRDMGNIKQLVF